MGTTGRRTVDRTDYQRYINSPEWAAVRIRYWASKLPKSCYACRRPRHPGMHLHHRTYKNLGAERLRDIVPMCQECHELVHLVQRGSGMHLWGATQAVARTVQGRRGRGDATRRFIVRRHAPQELAAAEERHRNHSQPPPNGGRRRPKRKVFATPSILYTPRSPSEPRPERVISSSRKPPARGAI